VKKLAGLLKVSLSSVAIFKQMYSSNFAPCHSKLSPVSSTIRKVTSKVLMAIYIYSSNNFINRFCLFFRKGSMNSLADKTMSVVTSVPKEQRNFIWKIENFEELVNFVIHKDESTIVKLPFNMVLTVETHLRATCNIGSI